MSEFKLEMNVMKELPMVVRKSSLITAVVDMYETKKTNKPVQVNIRPESAGYLNKKLSDMGKKYRFVLRNKVPYIVSNE